MRAVIFSALSIALLLGFAAWRLGFLGRSRYIRNHEMLPPGADSRFRAPVSIEDGLAVYVAGPEIVRVGETNGAFPRRPPTSTDASRVSHGGTAAGAPALPVLLFPYPHSDAAVPMAQSELAGVFTSLGRTVISFDPPGAFRSTRDPVGDMEEMIRCAREALRRLNVDGPVVVAGHSMGGLCGLAFAVEEPAGVDSLLLINSVSGFPAAARWGYPGTKWKWYEPQFRRVVWQGLRITNGRCSLADTKRYMNFLGENMYHNPDLFEPWEIAPPDEHTPVPVRAIWPKNMWRRLDYAHRLGEVSVPTLITVGRHDPETSLPCALELHSGIPNSELIVFEHSGHCPFVEEDEQFTVAVGRFLATRP